MSQQHGSAAWLSSMARYVQYTYQQVSILILPTRSRMLRRYQHQGRVVPPRPSPTDMSKAAAAVGATHQPEWTLPKRYAAIFSGSKSMSASRVLGLATRDSANTVLRRTHTLETSDFVSSILFDLLFVLLLGRVRTGMTSPSRT
jgi:hypothetical protein